MRALSNQVVTVKEMGDLTEFAPFDLLRVSLLPFWPKLMPAFRDHDLRPPALSG